MAEDNKRPATKELLLVTRYKLRKDRVANAELIESLGWLGSETQEKDQRVQDFEFVNQRLNELAESTASIPPQLSDVGLLAQHLKGRKIPNLEEARRIFYSSSDVARVITSTIERAVSEYPAWARVNPEYPSKGTPASGALIEGFGAFLGSFVSGSNNETGEASKINRHYVLAFEEVLITERPESPLVDDVIGWMKEERESFPQSIQPIIAEKSSMAEQK